MSPEEDRAMAMGSAHKISCRLVQQFQRYARGQTGRHTDRRVDHNTLHPYWGGVITNSLAHDDYAITLVTMSQASNQLTLTNQSPVTEWFASRQLTAAVKVGWNNQECRITFSQLFVIALHPLDPLTSCSNVLNRFIARTCSMKAFHATSYFKLCCKCPVLETNWKQLLPQAPL